MVEVNAATAQARTLVDEHPGAFFDYRPAVPGLTGSGRRFRADVGDGKEIVWMSERDGWSHLYLYDGTTGQVKIQITKGAWAVHNVDRVDETNRQIWFTANGMNADQDPYFFHSYRINFDGIGLVAYTSANAQHRSAGRPITRTTSTPIRAWTRRRFQSCTGPAIARWCPHSSAVT